MIPFATESKKKKQFRNNNQVSKTDTEHQKTLLKEENSKKGKNLCINKLGDKTANRVILAKLIYRLNAITQGTHTLKHSNQEIGQTYTPMEEK